jgi:hypothetical protein
VTCQITGRVKQPEEAHAERNNVLDFSDPRLKYANWSKYVALYILKDKISFNGCSFLSNSISKFTFIKKTKADHFENIIDINLMPPMIVKNCLPFKLVLKFLDSSNVPQTLTFEKNEEKSLFCFKMNNSVTVEIHIGGFQKKIMKLFDLENYQVTEVPIEIVDKLNRKTWIYVQISRENTGQKVIFHAKKVLIDSTDSVLQYFFKQPSGSLFGVNEEEQIANQIPYVVQEDIKQRIFIIPQRL